MVRVIAHIPAKREKVEEVKRLLASLIEPTRKEAGCIRYEMWQNTKEPADLTFVEEWASREALDAHLETEHVTSVLQQLGGLLSGEVDIRTYHLAA